MAKQTINIGASPNDGTGTPLRTSFDYCNQNFTELYTATGPSGNNIVVPGNATITGDLTVDTNTLKVDSANNRVGIGTASPSKPLEVYNTTESTVWANTTTGIALLRAGGTGGDFYFGIDNSTGGGFGQGNYSRLIYSTGAYPIVFSSNASERYRIASDGVATWSNVGGVAGTAMTLNSTGLAIGGTALGKFTAYSTTNGDTLAVFRCTGTGTQRGLYLSADNSTGVVSIDISGSSAGSLQFKSGGTNTMLIDTSGNVGIGVAPSAGGGCLQLKSGITFPATQVASSDANTLDDYEEGTWTGTIGGTTGNPTTPVTATGRYTKIGRQVYVEIGFYGDTTGASGRITVSGLPFTSNASTARPGAILMDTMGTFTGSPVAFLGSGVTSLDLYASNSNGSLSNVTHNAGAGRALYMALTYSV